MRLVIRRALIAAIIGYRRWLSGRGPLARVRCTFHHSESCSAFGLRAARDAPTVTAALGRIRRRLRRCRGAALFAMTTADGGHALGWGADHDRPLPELCAELGRDGETAAAQATVLASREWVARWRSDADDVRAIAIARRALPRAQVLMRRADQPPPRRWSRWILAVLALAMLAWWAPLVAVAAAASAGAVIALRTTRLRGLTNRLAFQAQAARLRGPLPVLPRTSVPTRPA